MFRGKQVLWHGTRCSLWSGPAYLPSHYSRHCHDTMSQLPFITDIIFPLNTFLLLLFLLKKPSDIAPWELGFQHMNGGGQTFRPLHHGERSRVQRRRQESTVINNNASHCVQCQVDAGHIRGALCRVYDCPLTTLYTCHEYKVMLNVNCHGKQFKNLMSNYP